MPWYLNPKNLLIIVLGVLLALLWAANQEKKIRLATCSGNLEVCQKDVAGFQAEITSAQGIIEAMRGNLNSIKKQMDTWKQIAYDAQEYSQRLLAAAESKKDCEVYHEENARLADEFVNGFNSRVRGKVNRPAPTDNRSAPEVLPKANGPNADKGDK